jgi:hypothetical protein
MQAELLDLPEIGVDVFGALNELGSSIVELTRKPTSEDPPETAQALKENQTVLSSFRRLYRSRPYFDKIDYTERLINYLVAYACKGEISAKDAAGMFRKLATSELPDDTPVESLARKLALRVLKARECPRPEIALSLQGLPFYRSSCQVNRPLPAPARPLHTHQLKPAHSLSIPSPSTSTLA